MKPTNKLLRGPRRKVEGLARFLFGCALVAAIVAAASIWLATKATTIKTELESAASLLPQLKNAIAKNNPPLAMTTAESMTRHTSVARAAGRDPVWLMASSLPVVGANFAAVSEVATAADDIARMGAGPLTQAFQALDWPSLLPGSGGVDWAMLNAQLPKVSSAAYAVGTSEERLRTIESDRLLPQVAMPLREATGQLADLRDGLNAAADAATLVPPMLAENDSRTYLLMVQNNAEARSSGGIPGALAELVIKDGRFSLGEQSSAADVGVMSPPLELDSEQQRLYSARAGKFMQDVNLTPDFPTAASTAQSMWERKTGKRVDGVISIDPVALRYILSSTGPVRLTNPQLTVPTNGALPAELTADNVVKTLLSDVYSEISEPEDQDAYFAAVAKEAFGAVVTGQGDAKSLMEGLARGARERRILIWSASKAEQDIIGRYPMSGAISGPSVSAAQFGVYFNDGTGAKMDYYVKRTAQLVKACARDGYEEVTVRITSTSTAPKDAATSLPAYVTGDGNYGVPPGSVQTNIVAYGPVQALVESAKMDGKRTNFAPYTHSNRPVGVLAIRLAPGESKTVEFTFSKIVQHTEPDLVVTPTVQPAKEVILPTKPVACA